MWRFLSENIGFKWNYVPNLSFMYLIQVLAGSVQIRSDIKNYLALIRYGDILGSGAEGLAAGNRRGFDFDIIAINLNWAEIEQIFYNNKAP